MQVSIRAAQSHEARQIHRLITQHQKWVQFNAPYFEGQQPDYESFLCKIFDSLQKGDERQLIVVDGQIVGSVNAYWECKKTRWLEAGIVIYNDAYWGRGIASLALRQWINVLYERETLERIGLTTWSGNPRMMALASKLGFKLEGQLRKVRYYNGQYHDAIRYGVLRSEWAAQNQPIDNSADNK